MKLRKNNILEFISNKKILFSVLLVFMVMFSLSLSLLDRATYSVDEEKDSLELVCDEAVSVGEEFKCTVVFNSVTMIAKGLTSKYILDDGIVFKNFELESDTDWTIETSDEDGFVVVNLTGVSGKVNIGTITFLMPDTAEANDKYNVQLVESTIGDGEETTVTLDDVTEEVRIYSDVNTLENITLKDGTLNETFEKDINNYSANVDNDKVTIEVIKTDDNSTISNNIGEQNLVYGTNKFEIVVTSEDGNDNIYTLNIYRKYHFTNEVYIYNEENNYLYTGDDTDDEILNNITLEEGLKKKIEDGKLIISDADEILLEINKLSISTDEYLIEDKVISVDNNLSLGDFIDNINISDKLKYKMMNGDSEVENSSILVSDMIFEIYYDDNMLDSYTIYVIKFNLSFDESIILDSTNKYIKYLSVDNTVKSLREKVDVLGGNVVVSDIDGLTKGDTSSLSTGDKLTIYKDDGEVYEEYTLSVLGDINGDGRVSLVDLVQLRKHIVGWIDKSTGNVYEKTGVYFYASDMNQNGEISLVDLVRVRKKIVGAN